MARNDTTETVDTPIEGVEVEQTEAETEAPKTRKKRTVKELNVANVLGKFATPGAAAEKTPLDEARDSAKAELDTQFAALANGFVTSYEGADEQVLAKALVSLATTRSRLGDAIDTLPAERFGL